MTLELEKNTNTENRQFNELLSKMNNLLTKLDVSVSNLNDNIEKRDETFERIIDRVYKDFDDLKLEVRASLKRKTS